MSNRERIQLEATAVITLTALTLLSATFDRKRKA